MTDRADSVGGPEPGRGVYGISVAAELTGIPVLSLRLYELHGLLRPARFVGVTRLYCADDLARLQRISELLSAGVNLAGIARILDLQDDNAALHAAHADLKSRTARQKAQRSKREGADGDQPADE